MMISTKGRYGLRAMIQLAQNYENGYLSMTEISKSQDISRKYLHSILTRLKNAGLLHVTLGNQGGYKLSKVPEEIQLKDIIVALEGPIAFISCVSEPTTCERNPSCKSYGVWKSLSLRVDELFASISLKEVALDELCEVS
jgi:Rrf2 family protein